jgi:hypothetical protein
LRAGGKAEYVKLRWREQQEGKGELHNEVLHHLYSSPNTVRMTKLKTKLQQHVAQTVEKKMLQNFSWKPERK